MTTPVEKALLAEEEHYQASARVRQAYESLSLLRAKLSYEEWKEYVTAVLARSEQRSAFMNSKKDPTAP